MLRERIGTQGIYLAIVLLAAASLAGCGRDEKSPAARDGERSAADATTPASPVPTRDQAPHQVAGNGSAAAVDTKVVDPESGDAPPASTATVEAKPEKPKREPIYDPEADGKALVNAALDRAKRDNKRVLIEWGCNWCGWCYKLHDVFKQDELVHPIVFEEYELVLVDSGTNRELLESYGGKDRSYSYPHLTILNADGSVAVNQNTEPLEKGPKHDPATVAEFLKRWVPEPLDAEKQLAAALQRAKDENKRVLVHVGTPYCGWCRVLSKFLHDQESYIARDYVDLKIDTRRMTNGEAVASSLQPKESGGIPWMVILDAGGKVLATSVGPDGNCGYPVQPAEIDHFMSMLAGTKQHMTEADFGAIRAALDAYRQERKRLQAEQKKA